LRFAEQGPFSSAHSTFSPAMLEERSQKNSRTGAAHRLRSRFQQFDLVKDDASGFPRRWRYRDRHGVLLNTLTILGRFFFGKSARMAEGRRPNCWSSFRRQDVQCDDRQRLSRLRTGARSAMSSRIFKATAPRHTRDCGALSGTRPKPTARRGRGPMSQGRSLPSEGHEVFAKFLPNPRAISISSARWDRCRQRAGPAFRRVEPLRHASTPLCFRHFERPTGLGHFNQVGWHMQQFPRKIRAGHQHVLVTRRLGSN